MFSHQYLLYNLIKSGDNYLKFCYCFLSMCWLISIADLNPYIFKDQDPHFFNLFDSRSGNINGDNKYFYFFYNYLNFLHKNTRKILQYLGSSIFS